MAITHYDPRMLGLEVAFKSRHNEVVCLCPFHHDTKPSASFNLITGKFYCFACGAGYSIRQLAEALEVPFDTIMTNRSVEEGREQDDNWREIMKLPLGLGNDYLAFRGLSDAEIVKYRILADSERVYIPLQTRDGLTTGFQSRRVKDGPRPKYLFHGQRTLMWPFEQVQSFKREQPIVIVEGVFGAIRGLSFGHQVVACMSASMAEAVAKTLNGHRRLGVFDNDDAGRQAAAKLVSLGIPVWQAGAEADEADEEMWARFADGRDGFTTAFQDVLAGAKDRQRLTGASRRHPTGWYDKAYIRNRPEAPGTARDGRRPTWANSAVRRYHQSPNG